MTRIGIRSTSRTVRNLTSIAFGALVLAFSTPAFVHHSGAMFDREKVINITGTVTEFNWTNPHASFRVDVPNAQGKVESWAIEMNSPNNLVHLGWKRSSIKPGDKVTIGIRPEHLTLGGGDNSFDTRIDFIERLGGVSYAYANGPITGEALTLRLPDDSTAAIGDTVRVAPLPADVHVFDADGAAFPRPRA